MKIELKGFQETASEDVLVQLRAARREISDAAIPQAVVLSAPTGAGKTVVVTDVIEKLLEGHEEQAPEADAVFLWLTDLPELNQQTKKKMLAVSTVLLDSSLLTIDANFDSATLEPRRVYFLNIQKLARGQPLTEPSDSRAHTIWQTISNTVRHHASHLYLIIDEAHRGMTETPRERRQANSIVQKFIKGSEGEIPPIPLIVGISATPDRFRTVIAGTTRVLRQVDVDAVDVRESGLLKDYVRFRIPRENVPADTTLLKNAVQRWQEMTRDWQAYCLSQGEQIIVPILIVQVEDGNQGKLSNTDLAAALASIEEVTGAMPVDSYAHAFQEGGTVDVGGGRRLRYLAPSEISDDDRVRVVFFKTSLSTGWDCPRAEVMMSFRRAKDATYIAQLVGRMVRTPLARRVEKNENLNGVSLILPHYDGEELKNVVDRLRASDPDAMPPVEFEEDDEFVTLSRSVGLDQCFSVLQDVPSYVLPGRRRMTEIRRLMKLARLLVNDNLKSDAIDEATAILLSAAKTQLTALSSGGAFKEKIDGIGRISIDERIFSYGDDAVEVADEIWALASAEDVDEQLTAVGRRVGEGLQKIYWRQRAAECGIEAAKRETIALLSEPGVLESLNSAARQLTAEWLRNYQTQTRVLPEAQRQGYDEIRRTAAEPQVKTLEMPETIDTRRGNANWHKHLYVDTAGSCPVTLNRWERFLLERELSQAETFAWMRNWPLKPYSLCVPYEFAGQYKPLFPDFFTFRGSRNDPKLDLFDPHRLDLEDSPAKAAGLARYVDKHANVFGRVILAIFDGNELKSLDLMDEQVRTRVRAVTTSQHLRDLYDML